MRHEHAPKGSAGAAGWRVVAEDLGRGRHRVAAQLAGRAPILSTEKSVDQVSARVAELLQVLEHEEPARFHDYRCPHCGQTERDGNLDSQGAPCGSEGPAGKVCCYCLRTNAGALA